MTFIYIDESGFLGQSKSESHYFVVSCIKIDSNEEHEKLKRIPKKVKQRTLSKKTRKRPEVKFSNSNTIIRERVLKQIAKHKVEIYAVIIKKSLAKKKLQENLPILYNYLLKILLEKPLQDLRNRAHLHICLDKTMSQSQKENFENYIKTEFLSLFSDLPEITIVHETSSNSPCLQMADFVCGSFGYKYNTCKLGPDCEKYLNLIRDKVKVEKNDLFKSERPLPTRPELHSGAVILSIGLTRPKPRKAEQVYKTFRVYLNSQSNSLFLRHSKTAFLNTYLRIDRSILQSAI